MDACFQAEFSFYFEGKISFLWASPQMLFFPVPSRSGPARPHLGGEVIISVGLSLGVFRELLCCSGLRRLESEPRFGTSGGGGWGVTAT